MQQPPSGASVSAALARTLARQANAVVRVVCVNSLRQWASHLPGDDGRVNWAYRCAGQGSVIGLPAGVLLREYGTTCSSRLGAKRGVAGLPGAGLEPTEHRHGGPVRLTGPPPGQCPGGPGPLEAPMP